MRRFMFIAQLFLMLFFPNLAAGDDPKQEGWWLEGEQSRSRRTVKLWLAAQDK